jgi:addiction module HigA family antidote
MTAMHEPPHPGETLKEDILPELGITATEAADQLNVSRVTFSRVLNGKAAISPSMALKLEQWLGGPEHGPSAESWLTQQMHYSLWQEQQSGDHSIKKPATA